MIEDSCLSHQERVMEIAILWSLFHNLFGGPTIACFCINDTSWKEDTDDSFSTKDKKIWDLFSDRQLEGFDENRR